jgi:SAM-dependent methyltransferase
MTAYNLATIIPSAEKMHTVTSLIIAVLALCHVSLAWVSYPPLKSLRVRSPTPCRRIHRHSTSSVTDSSSHDDYLQQPTIDTKDGSATATNTRSIYSMPALYDLAFGYRDFEQEVDFLLNVHEKATRRSSSSSDKAATTKQPYHILELAAGPARHSLTALQQYHDHRVASVTCVDTSVEMKAYAQELWEREFSPKPSAATITTKDAIKDNDDSHSKLHYVVQDMRSFKAFPPSSSSDDDDTTLFDTAWILLGSLQHLTTNEDVLQCFRSLHASLQVHGTVILELPHPRETFGMMDMTRNAWTVPRNDEDDDHERNSQVDDDDEEEGSDKGAPSNQSSKGELDIVWGDEDDDFDPIAQVRQFTVAMQVKNAPSDDDKLPQSIRQVVPMRLFTAQEIDALALCSGFRVLEMYGALMEGVSVHDEDEAFRLVCVLQKQ